MPLNALAVGDDLWPSQRRGTWVLSPQAPPAIPKYGTTQQPKGEDRPSRCNETIPPIPQENGKQAFLDSRRRWHRHRCRSEEDEGGTKELISSGEDATHQRYPAARINTGEVEKGPAPRNRRHRRSPLLDYYN
jgi:hypothetical protein